MSLSVRPALKIDLTDLVGLASRTFPLACPPAMPHAAVAAFIREHLCEEVFTRHLDDPTHAVLVATDIEGVIIAYAILIDGTGMDPACDDLVRHRPTIAVSKFYVDAGHHGTGTADTLLAAIVDRASIRGARSLWLATNVQNLRARRFYTKHGFVERGERTFVVSGMPNQDVVYETPLQPDPASPTRARTATAPATGTWPGDTSSGTRRRASPR